jgi:hypothetical protein
LAHPVLRDKHFSPFRFGSPRNAAPLLGLRRSARLVQIVSAEHHPGIRCQVGEGNVDAGDSDSAADPPDFARAVIHFQDKYVTLFLYLKFGGFEGAACSGSVFDQNVKHALALNGQPTQAFNIYARLAQGFA